MSEISSCSAISANIGDIRITADVILDVIPLVSTVFGVVDGCEKVSLVLWDKAWGNHRGMEGTLSSEHSYNNYLHDKKWEQIGVSMIPIYGNIKSLTQLYRRIFGDAVMGGPG